MLAREIDFLCTADYQLTKHKCQAIAVVDAPAEDAVSHAPVGGSEDLGNQGAAHRPEM